MVISRSPSSLLVAGWPSLPTEANARLRQIWQDMQSELAGLSSDSTHVIAAHASHDIPNQEPTFVVDAILELVNKARSR